MTRPIKFRAWNKQWGMMIQPKQMYSFICDGDGIYGVQFFNETTDGQQHQEEWCEEGDGNVVLMQFTGLHDKNGVPIYEGDILDYPQEEMRISIKWGLSGAGWEFDEHGTFDDGVGRGEWRFTTGIAKSSEVIGNIWEHPHLLKNV